MHVCSTIPCMSYVMLFAEHVNIPVWTVNLLVHRHTIYMLSLGCESWCTMSMHCHIVAKAIIANYVASSSLLGLLIL